MGNKAGAPIKRMAIKDNEVYETMCGFLYEMFEERKTKDPDFDPERASKNLYSEVRSAKEMKRIIDEELAEVEAKFKEEKGRNMPKNTNIVCFGIWKPPIEWIENVGDEVAEKACLAVADRLSARFNLLGWAIHEDEFISEKGATSVHLHFVLDCLDRETGFYNASKTLNMDNKIHKDFRKYNIEHYLNHELIVELKSISPDFEGLSENFDYTKATDEERAEQREKVKNYGRSAPIYKRQKQIDKKREELERISHDIDIKKKYSYDLEGWIATEEQAYETIKINNEQKKLQYEAELEQTRREGFEALERELGEEKERQLQEMAQAENDLKNLYEQQGEAGYQLKKAHQELEEVYREKEKAVRVKEALNYTDEDVRQTLFEYGWDFAELVELKAESGDYDSYFLSEQHDDEKDSVIATVPTLVRKNKSIQAEFEDGINAWYEDKKEKGWSLYSREYGYNNPFFYAMRWIGNTAKQLFGGLINKIWKEHEKDQGIDPW